MLTTRAEFFIGPLRGQSSPGDLTPDSEKHGNSNFAREPAFRRRSSRINGLGTFYEEERPLSYRCSCNRNNLSNRRREAAFAISGRY